MRASRCCKGACGGLMGGGGGGKFRLHGLRAGLVAAVWELGG